MSSRRLTERILRIRELEEHEGRRALELALAELAQLELALRTARQRERAGRNLVNASASSGDVADRIAGMEESRSSSRTAAALTLRIRSAENEVEKLRQQYLAQRTSRQQAEMLADSEREREEIAGLRRSQRLLDDWYLNRKGPDEDPSDEDDIKNT